jgi:hypothetical protein
MNLPHNIRRGWDKLSYCSLKVTDYLMPVTVGLDAKQQKYVSRNVRLVQKTDALEGLGATVG